MVLLGVDFEVHVVDLCLAAMRAASVEESFGMTRLCGKNSTVSAIRFARVLVI